jgi:hypothetical protein
MEPCHNKIGGRGRPWSRVKPVATVWPTNAHSGSLAGPYGRQNGAQYGPQRSRSTTDMRRSTPIFTLSRERVPLAFQAGYAGSIPVTRSPERPLHSKDFRTPTAICCS